MVDLRNHRFRVNSKDMEIGSDYIYIYTYYMFHTCSRFQMLAQKSTIYIDTNGLSCLPQVEEWNT